MSQRFTKPHLEAYMQELYDDGDPVRREMAVLAKECDFPLSDSRWPFCGLVIVGSGG